MNTEQATEWQQKSLAERAQLLRYHRSSKDKFGFRLNAPPCAFEWLAGTVRWVSTPGALVHINGGKGIGLVEVPIEHIIDVVTELD